MREQRRRQPLARVQVWVAAQPAHLVDFEKLVNHDLLAMHAGVMLLEAVDVHVPAALILGHRVCEPARRQQMWGEMAYGQVEGEEGREG